jgi:hypothetical protein
VSVIFDSRILLFAGGFLLAGALFFDLQAGYEKRLFASIGSEIKRNTIAASDDSIFKAAVHTTFELLEARSKVFNKETTGGIIDNLIHPVSADMMTADGSCGSYATVLARLLQSMGYETRFAQMRLSDGTIGHIVIEARARHGWAVLDPRYNLFFEQSNGQLASFDEVAANWSAYSRQVPAGYDPDYNYAGVRYTNWDKVPLLLPALHSTLSLFMPKDQLEHFSLRNYFLSKYIVCRNILMLVASFILGMLVPRLFRKSLLKPGPYLYRAAHEFHSNSARA